MNKPHYPWWGYIKAIVREYPGQENADPSGVAKLNQDAIRGAIESTKRMANGQNRLEVIKLLHWSRPRTLTLDGAALAVPCSRSLAAQWQREFFEEIARNRALLD